MTKAIRIHRQGGPEVMLWEDVEIGAPAPGQLRMRNTAVAVNYRDVCIRAGIHDVDHFPSGLGFESAGIVDAIGSGVTGFAVGDRIACVAGPDSAYAEERLIPAARAVKLPDGLDDKVAASLMIRGMTARYLTHDTHKLVATDTILLHAAAGGVGTILAQWAKHIGATVIGTVGSDAKVASAARFCDCVIVYTREDFVARVHELTDGKGVDVVYDAVGKDTFAKSLHCLRPRGLMVSFGEASGDPEPVHPRELGHLGSIYLTHPSLPNYTAGREALLTAANDVFRMVLEGKITTDITQTYPLRDAAQAHADMQGRKTTGTVVLIP